jgi:hypothetical protein
MATHQVTVTVPSFEVQRTDLVVSVNTEGGVHGDLYVSQGSIDWRSRYQHESTVHALTWEKFDEIMRAAREGRLHIDPS